MAMSQATAFQLQGDLLDDYVLILRELLHHRKQARNDLLYKVKRINYFNYFSLKKL